MSMRRIVLSSVACPAVQYFFSNYLTNCPIFEKKVIVRKMCVLIFSTTCVSRFSHCKKNWARCDHEYILVFILSTRYSCPIWTKLEFSRQIFQKYSNQISQIFVQGELSCSMRTDRHDEATCRFSQFCRTRLKVCAVNVLLFLRTYLLIISLLFHTFVRCWWKRGRRDPHVILLRVCDNRCREGRASWA